jgi:hypothetical protein
MTNEQLLRCVGNGVSDAVVRQALLRQSALGAAGTVRPQEIEYWEQVRSQIQSRLRLPWGNETAAVLAAVAAHRAYWRPAEVRLLVLSESHVLTRESELAVKVPLAVFGHPEAPTSFVRLLYCLGYGERDLCDGHLQGNAGSPQFWKLVTGGLDEARSASVVERSEPDFMRRLTAKLRVLEELKARGVWLLDACPLALYAASQPKPRMAMLAQAMELAWPAYTRAAIREAAPRAVMIVGKMVHDGIGARIRALLGPSVPVGWMYQPQARRPAAEHRAGIGRLQAMIRNTE